MRDLFWKANSVDMCCRANDFNSSLTGGMPFEERTYTFKYTDVLYEKEYVEHLHRWLNQLNQPKMTMKRLINI